MIKRVAVAGCRHYENYDEAKEYIDFCISEIRKKYTPPIGKNTAERQDLNETKESPKSAIILYAFGTEKAEVQNLC